jgi:hypothetical protein
MLSLLRKLLSRKSSKVCREVRQARLRIECLEAREVPAVVTSHGGPALTNVQAQALYLGSDWLNSTYNPQAHRLDSFLGNIVNSSYMDMLHNAGYGVGRGSANSGAYWSANIDKTQYVQDSTIQNYLTASIDAGLLQPAGANNLYVVFLEDNVAFNAPAGNSFNNLGYHSSFNASLIYPWGGWYGANIHYAVVAYPGGTVPLATGSAPNGNYVDYTNHSWLSAQDAMTVAASHELAEAVTDPQVWQDSSGFHGTGWHDGTSGNSLGQEIGDISNAQTVYLNGYAVQREADQNEQAMTPLGAKPVSQVNFVLDKSGNLYVGSGSNLTHVWTAAPLTYMSDQGIDNYGHAMVDVVRSDGTAWEYHAGGGPGGGVWVYLDNGVKVAKAGQGVSYLLYTNGNVGEWKDWGSGSTGTSPTKNTIDGSGGAISIDAGTDRYGVNMMTEVWSYNPSSYTFGQEYSDSTGWSYVDNGNYTVKTLSAGQMGNIGILYNNGTAVWHNDAGGWYWTEGSNVTQFTMGTDENGNVQFDMLYGNGTVSQYSQADGWRSTSTFQSIGKAHSGWVDAISGTTAYAEYFGTWQWQWLASNAAVAA